MTFVPSGVYRPITDSADLLPLHDGVLQAAADGTPRDGDAGGGPPGAGDPSDTHPARLAFPESLDALVAQVVAGPDPVRAALEVSRLTVTRMAEELGIPRATLAAYRLGTRRMPAAGRARLAAYLAAHSKALARVARALGAEDV